MSDYMSILPVGAGYMGKEYGKVLNDMNVPYSVVCRSDASALKFNEEVGVMPIEFTKWGFKIEKTSHSPEVKEGWLLANSTHVIDLAFFLGGCPKMCSFHFGKLDWHSKASKYVSAGVTENGALFSYQANWDALGCWAVEVLTKEHRLY